ncbi:hypothetical protein L9F63_004302 [Diploptera punctata]|uniref:Uncharacterized protein n=1 Tax=Diploptera punctata TaxID=6984 RepID=A0AAD7ZG05_DIPPU|nr:hypothetical protein L9F63_004302 [Diploptera punctata]
MSNWLILCAVVTLCLSIYSTDGSVMHCGDDNDCPDNHCCLAVGEEYICSPHSRQGQPCQVESTQHNAGKNYTYVGHCGCAVGLHCEMTDASSSSESDSIEQPVCKSLSSSHSSESDSDFV